MKKHIVICPFCKQSFDAQPEGENKEWIKIKRRYAHMSCYIDHEQSMTQEEKDLRDLVTYIQQLLGDDYVYMKVKKQIEEYHNKFQYSYTGMLSSLKWYYEVQNNKTDKANGGVGIIPYIYNDAKKYYYNIYLAQQKNATITNYQVPVKEISIQSPRMYERPPHLWFENDEEDED